MSGHRPILFDLDGTIADTYEGIVLAVSEMLASFGLAAVERRRVEALTGKGVEALVSGVLDQASPGAGEQLRGEAVARYRALYARTCVEGTRLYPGMAELLARLPRPLALLTNKARPFTDQILLRLGLAAHFDVVVAGDDPGMRLKPDPWAIDAALERLSAPREAAILVGDTASDVEAAHRARIACCVVRWGHGGLAAAQDADATADDVAELEAILLRGPGAS